MKLFSYSNGALYRRELFQKLSIFDDSGLKKICVTSVGKSSRKMDLAKSGSNQSVCKILVKGGKSSSSISQILNSHRRRDNQNWKITDTRLRADGCLHTIDTHCVHVEKRRRDWPVSSSSLFPSSSALFRICISGDVPRGAAHRTKQEVRRKSARSSDNSFLCWERLDRKSAGLLRNSTISNRTVHSTSKKRFRF